MDVEKAKKQLLDALDKHEEVWEWIRLLDDGIGTYEEVSKIAEIAGDEIASTLAGGYSEDLLDAYMRAGHGIISDIGEQAQRNLNDAAHVGIAPMKTKYPKAKVRDLAYEIAVADPESVPVVIANGVPTLALTMVDDIVKYNADFQADAGLRPIIVRTWSGSYPSHDTKHTDWCHDLAGEYEYRKEPRNVYARHKGCRCRVEYFPSKDAKGRITALAKGEIDRSGVLWNTRADTLGQRLRRAKRNK